MGLHLAKPNRGEAKSILGRLNSPVGCSPEGQHNPVAMTLSSGAAYVPKSLGRALAQAVRAPKRLHKQMAVAERH